MREHKGQITAAVVIGVLFALLFAGYAVMYLVIDEIPAIMRAGFAGLMIAFAAAMIAVLVGRIREIRKGETDDLDNY